MPEPDVPDPVEVPNPLLSPNRGGGGGMKGGGGKRCEIVLPDLPVLPELEEVPVVVEPELDPELVVAPIFGSNGGGIIGPGGLPKRVCIWKVLVSLPGAVFASTCSFEL